MTEERLQILKMLETGKVSSEEAMRLLEAVERGEARTSSPKARWLRIRVREGERESVNVNLPISLLSVVTKFIPEKHLEKMWGMEEHGLDIESLVEAIKEGSSGKLVEVHDQEDDTHVEIILE